MKKEIKQLLIDREKQRLNDPRLVDAAVLVPVFKKDSGWYVLYTKRTETVKDHKGQISFPGGKADATDKDYLHTALREGFEEIGLDPADVEVLGELDEEETATSNFVIHPYLAIIPYPYDFKLSPAEVAELVEVPAAALMDEANFSDVLVPEATENEHRYSYTYNGHVIWGATAMITKKLIDLFTEWGRSFRAGDSSTSKGLS